MGLFRIVCYDYGLSLKREWDGGYIVTGSFNFFGYGNQVYFIKTNISGISLWTKAYGGPNLEYSYSIRQTQDGGCIVAGSTLSFGNSWQVYLIKTDAKGTIEVVETGRSTLNVKRSTLKITPTLFTSFVTLPENGAVLFNLYDISGREVGQFRGESVGKGLSPGVYFLKPERGVAELLRIVKVR